MSDNSPNDAAAPAGGWAARARRHPALLLAIAALAFATWQWFDHRGDLNELRQELARRLAESDARSRESRMLADQVREATREAQVKLGVLEAKLAESQSQQIALESLYQELSRNRDDWAFAEIEQSLLLASQQLQLAGNVKGALIALGNADARLQRMNRPQFTALRKALVRDMERLKAAPYVDTIGISVRIDSTIAAVDRLPLAMDTRPRAAVPVPAATPGESAWTRFWREAWAELRSLIRVQRVDQPEAALITPDQSYFLRENLKLRLIGARLALLARDQESYKADLKAAREWLAKYYDPRDKSVVAAAATLRALHETELGIEVPDLSASLEALRNQRLVRERAAR